MPSPFLDKPPTDWVASNALAFAIRDGFPVSPGHTLVVPRREVATWFEASRDEQQAVFDLVDQVRRDLERSHQPDGFNIGINVGAAAGQTVFHLHVHVIPRYDGDVADPRGGVRHVIPELANYLKADGVAESGHPKPFVEPRRPHAPRPLSTGAPADPFTKHLSQPFASASAVSILAAFVQDSGLVLLDARIQAGLSRGATVRLLTGDYLHITQARALRRLLDWQEEAALKQAEDPAWGTLEARVVEVKTLQATSFHPKAWCFQWADAGTAFVGSSNISQAALQGGVEWNLRVDQSADPAAFRAVVDGYEQLWGRATPLDSAWVDAYGERARVSPAPLPTGEAETEPPRAPPVPRPLQKAALKRLRQAREDDRDRALLVLATGVGKTVVAALDAHAFQAEHPQARILVLAHRAEILRQAAETFRWLMPDATFTWCAGDRDDLTGAVVLASVQKLSRPERLADLTPETFDYVVVDEVHHAAAETWRRVVAHLRPRFLLGLTATPERTDGADILGLFDDFVAYRADVGVAIQGGYLVPFRYHGLKDTTDYAPIPWRSGRFETEALSQAIETEARMARMWASWQEHPATRTIVFCASIRHLRFVEAWLTGKGLAVASVHSGPDSADRVDALERLAEGRLDAVCAVDLLNEGVDIPRVDRVVMLRPTESRVLFLQQLGRGLRLAPDKGALIVLDFVGNHRVFLDRMRLMLNLMPGAVPMTVRAFLAGRGDPVLPDGCSIDIELEAKDLLAKLLPTAGGQAVVAGYRDLRASSERRPTATDMMRAGLNYRKAPAEGGWFGFVESEGDLEQPERAARRVGGDWLKHIEVSQMTKCFKMVVLTVLLDHGALWTGMALDELAERCHRLLVRDPELIGDILGVRALPDPRRPGPGVWLSYWNQNPIRAWTNGRWFRTDAGRLVPRVPTPETAEAQQALVEMTRELVHVRMAAYRLRRRTEPSGARFVCKVIWNQRDPILKLPSRTRTPELPEGALIARVGDGETWSFRLMKIACNVAAPQGADGNQLPALLRRWFGARAGQPGTQFRVRFEHRDGAWWVEPFAP